MKTNFKNDLAPAVIELNRMNEELQAEIERLKVELKNRTAQSDANANLWMKELRTGAKQEKEIEQLQKENAKLKCLALHLFSSYFFDCFWNSKGLDPNRYLHLHEKYEEAYRKAKKALMERNDA